MLAQRIITAMVGIAATILIVYYGQWLFALAVLLLTLLAWHEYYNMMVRRQVEIAYYLGMLNIIFIWGTAWLGNSKETVAVILLAAFLLLAKTVISHSRFNLQDAVYTFTGVCYIGLAFAHLVLLRFTDNSTVIATGLGGSQPAGAAYLWLAFIGTWASDTFAFFVGSTLGKHKLAPAVSPGKTWEGVIGGGAGSCLALLALGWLWHLPLLHCVCIGLVIGFVAPLGDLVESAMKRFAGVKDSGRLLPGHGGVLDRFDSILFTVPAVYYYIYIFFLR
ncbi:MAG: phosphatidate cytidylyltransferase [Negativicutes bacterium]|nr:phosphatidate cytidylyltransferase [Negativicutes bacterium]